MSHHTQQPEDAFLDDLDEAVSQKYLPRRQPNPHLKKYYSGKRALPWRLSILAAHVSGSQWDLDEYRRYLWEQEQKSQLERQRRLEQARTRTRYDPAEHDEGDSRQRKRTRSGMNNLKFKTNIGTAGTDDNTIIRKGKTKPNPKEKQYRRHLSHLMSALNATSKRQGWLAYYTHCSCCYLFDRPWILREQYMKRSLPSIIAEGREDAISMAEASWGATTGDSGMVQRPRNSQTGRARFHEGREKAFSFPYPSRAANTHRNMIKNRASIGWVASGPPVRFGGRGIRAWMKQHCRNTAVVTKQVDTCNYRMKMLGIAGDDDDSEMYFGLEDIIVDGPGYWVRSNGRFKLGRGQAGLSLNERMEDTISLGTCSGCWDVDEAEFSSDHGSAIWLREEWVCLGVDGDEGSDGEMALSWIEVEDIFEDGET